MNQDKGLCKKIINTIKRYCDVEKQDAETIETILLTGGGLKLSPNDKGATAPPGLRKKLVSKLKKEVVNHFPKARIIFSEDPQVGSILGGAQTLFAMSSFE